MDRFSADTERTAMQLRFWLRLTGFFNVVVGGLMCLTVCYAFWGLVQILLGVLAIQSGDHLRDYLTYADPDDFERFLGTMRTKFLYFALIFVAVLAGIAGA